MNTNDFDFDLPEEIINEDSTLKEEKNKKLKEMVEEKFTTKEEIII